MKRFATTILAFGIMLAALPGARADTTCPPNPSPLSTVKGNLVVTGVCNLIGVTVTGNVQVQTNAVLSSNATAPASTIIGNVDVGTGATLDAEVGGLTIDGNVKANQCLSVDLRHGVIIGGNVRIQYCTGESDVVSDDIAGNVACDNSSTCLVAANHVNGNVHVDDNSNADVSNNTIDNNLECRGNATLSASGNQVGGKSQCPGS